ncbi:helix-hairpin-helix domain-containing protein [bacterium]|nr:helix-hairpin-helix domain-containing protein [bacterium]
MILTKGQRVTLAVALGFAVLAVGVVFARRAASPQALVVENTAATRDAAADAGTGRITVHVVGAVRSPNVYTLAGGSRVYQAVQAAGGFSAEACPEWMNLASPLKDGQQVCVPSRAAQPSSSPQPSTAAPPVHQPDLTVCAGTPASTGSAGVSGPTRAAPPQPSTSAGPSSQTLRKGGTQATPAPGQVHLNSATAEELEALPGVGPVVAGRIVSYRQTVGPFRRVEDLLQVKGIGEKTFARMKPYLSL